jgi:iron complex transport system substrate-binding protein
VRPLVIALLICAACARSTAPAPGAGRRAIRDELGRNLQLPAEVKRIVSLSPSSTEILFAIGAGEHVVGRDRYSDWPPEVTRIETVGANLEPSLERILALRPDVVFSATTANSQATVEALERAGVPVFVSKAETLEQIYTDLGAIGAAVGREAQAAELVKQMRARLAALHARHAGRPAVPMLVIVWTEPLVVAGKASHLEDLITAAGGVNLADDGAVPFPNYSLERMVARAPEVVVVGTHAYGSPPLAPLERLTTLPAVRNHRLHTVDGDLLFRPGPRVVEGAEALARLLFPEEDHVPRHP